MERHQTLRQAVDWSYDLLARGEQEMLNRLGVFAGGFTLDAAEAVISGDGIDALEVFDSVASLVDKSLVVADQSPGETRYRLLETIRQYALERLDVDGTADATRHRHAQWFVSFLEGARDLWLVRTSSSGMGESTAKPTTFVPRSHGRWSIEETDLAVRLVGDVQFFSMMFREEGYKLAALAASALLTPGAEAHPSYSSVLAVRSLDHQNHGRFDDAERDARAAIRHMSAPGRQWTIVPWGALWSTLIFTGRAEELLPHSMRSSHAGQQPATTSRCSPPGISSSVRSSQPIAPQTASSWPKRTTPSPINSEVTLSEP